LGFRASDFGFPERKLRFRSGASYHNNLPLTDHGRWLRHSSWYLCDWHFFWSSRRSRRHARL